MGGAARCLVVGRETIGQPQSVCIDPRGWMVRGSTSNIGLACGGLGPVDAELAGVVVRYGTRSVTKPISPYPEVRIFDGQSASLSRP